MEPRTLIAYAIIAVMVLAAAAWIGYAGYNTHDRKTARRRKRESDARVKRELL